MTPLPPLLLPPELDTTSALWNLIGAWGRANADSDIREKALRIDAEVHRLMQAYATAHGEAVAAALAPKWLPAGWSEGNEDFDAVVDSTREWLRTEQAVYLSLPSVRKLVIHVLTPTPPKGETP